MAEYLDATIARVIDQFEAARSRADVAVGILGVLGAATGSGSVPAVIAMTAWGLMSGPISEGIEDVRASFGQAFWAGLAEALYCDAIATLATEAWTGEHYYNVVETYVTNPANLSPASLRTAASLILKTVDVRTVTEWARTSDLLPPPGACQDCPPVEQDYTWEWNYEDGNLPDDAFLIWHVFQSEFGVSNTRNGTLNERHLLWQTYGILEADATILKIEAQVYRAAVRKKPCNPGEPNPSVPRDRLVASPGYNEYCPFVTDGFDVYVRDNLNVFWSADLPARPSLWINLNEGYDSEEDTIAAQSILSWVKVTYRSTHPIVWSADNA